MHIITTPLGDIGVDVQDGRTAYVRAGQSGDREPNMPGPLTVRGLPINVRGHWKRQDDGQWIVPRSHYLSTGRADVWRDATPTMDDAIKRAVGVALGEHLGADELHTADRAKAEQEANGREADAAQLVEIAKQLRAEARALRKGGRVVYLKVPLSSGANERVRTVEMPSGRRLMPVRECPTISGASRYLHRNGDRASIQNAPEED